MKKRKLVIILAGVLVIALLVSGCKTTEQTNGTSASPSVVVPDVVINQPETTENRTITVSGSGEVKAEPDTANVTISLSTSGATAEEASAQNSETMVLIMDSLKKNGVADKDITTLDVYLNEQYDYSKEPEEIIGYEMTNSLSVTIRDISMVGTILSNAISAGATNTYGLQFSVSESNDGYADALAAAVSDAKVKAQRIAEALGVTIDAVPLSTMESTSSYNPVVYSEIRETPPMTDSASADVAVSTGEITVSAKVSVVYVIIENAQG